MEQELHEYNLICQKCGKPYQLKLTEKDFESGKFRKHCSRSCANSRVRTNEVKRKISKSIKSHIKSHGGWGIMLPIHNKCFNCIHNVDCEYKTSGDDNLCTYEPKIEIFTCGICGKRFTSKDIRDLKSHKFCSKKCMEESKHRKRNMDTKLKGDITELEVLTYATKLGIKVSVPFGDRARYDQIWDINGKLLRIQIKSPRLSNGVLEISCKSTNRGNGRYIQHSYNENEIDAIVTFFEGDCYFIPVKDINKNSVQLRLDESKNGQKSKIKFAKDYKIEKILNGIHYRDESRPTE